MRTGQRFVQPFSDAAGGAGIVVLQARGEIREEPRRRLHVTRLIGPSHGGLIWSSQQFSQFLGGFHPAEGLSRPVVEHVRHSIKMPLSMRG